MQALILAAGMGKRLGDLTKDNTKCMLEINGTTLIEQSFENMSSVGITHCVMVVGYKQENVRALLGDVFKNIKVTYVENPVYDSTNNIYSLFLAKDFLVKEDTILLESDLVYDVSILEDLIHDPRKNLAVVDQYQSWMDGTVVKINDQDEITSFIPKKHFDYQEIGEYYKTVNIYKFSKEFSENSYIPFLEAYSIALGKNEYYEQVLRVITAIENQDLKALKLKLNQKWYEIDDVQDKSNAESVFAPSPEIKLNRMQQRYGGYWRFPNLKDFCYLVNPYFPSDRMNFEIKTYFSDLLSQYPSGQSIQRLLAAKMFEVPQECILVGNGAAELIRALSRVLDGTCGIVFPSFNEYAESFGEERVVALNPDSSDFSYGVGQVLELSKSCETVLLINPDNPSGNFIPKKDISTIAKSLAENGKRLILDESFVDFSTEGEVNSCLDTSFVKKYPNVIIIKSISKSYGVPGVRLGVLVSSDESIIEAVKKELSIWNINSFGEFFLQIIGKYKGDYNNACVKIAHERDRFYSELKMIDYLKPVYSQANYFLCEVLQPYDSTDLSHRLLD